MHWPKEQRVFACQAYLSNNRSVIATQRAFRTRFNIHPKGRVPGRQSIVLWVKTFTKSGNVVKSHSARHRTVRTQENIECVRVSVSRSPQRSARKQAAALGISDRTFRRILHQDLQFRYLIKIIKSLKFYIFIK